MNPFLTPGTFRVLVRAPSAVGTPCPGATVPLLDPRFDEAPCAPAPPVEFEESPGADGLPSPSLRAGPIAFVDGAVEPQPATTKERVAVIKPALSESFVPRLT